MSRHRGRRTWVAAVAIGAAALLGLALVSSSRADEPEKLSEGMKIVSLEVWPERIDLAHPFAYAQLLVTGRLETGEAVDATRMATFTSSSDLLAIDARGLARPQADGAGELTVAVGGLTAQVPVTVSGQADEFHPSFVRHVMPQMSKLGCNMGTCHGADKGKNGFKLSLRGYDPLFDHRALVDDLAGRRFNRVAPDQSLMLLKPSGGVPHQGGVLTKPGEPAYELLRQWIADGVTLDLDSPRVTSIEIRPQDPQLPLPGMRQQMAVVATYSDGTTRDVSAEAFVETSLGEVVEVDKQGLATAVRRGEAALLARYEGRYAATTVTVMGDRTGFVWQEVPEHNYVDTRVYEKLKRVKIQPSELCTDAEFLRRVYLDLMGLAPEPAEIRAFLADSRPTREKRDAVIDRLVGSPEFVAHWSNKWSDLLQVNRTFLTEKGAWALRDWIRRAVAHNMPYDQFAKTVLTASGSTFENPAASYMRVLREPELAMENSTQLFLGVRFNCNKCHDHPFERWTQDQYYDLAAYFVQVGRKPGLVPGDEVIFDMQGGEEMHPRTGQPVAPQFPYAHADVAPDGLPRREQFAYWATSIENPYFATSYVNRLFSYLLGIGIIEPVDDIRAGNPPTNPALLEQLTDDFITSGFDTQHLLKTITKSRVYQHSLATNRWNDDDKINYSHAMARRLPAETLYDTVQRATGAPIKLPGLPAGQLATQLPDSHVSLPGGFLDLFGRPPRESACECERSSGVVLGQALNLVNGPTVADAIASQENRISRLVASEPENTRLVEELFLAILCRPPTEAEIATGTEAIREAEDRLTGAQDLAWALINSPAFLFNH
ncbi:MAG: DUF1549 domain-containing protein [Pirellulales bacterium]|nr:DUF1549 domain-containing protein [Pirellulales bacterium]